MTGVVIVLVSLIVAYPIAWITAPVLIALLRRMHGWMRR